MPLVKIVDSLEGLHEDLHDLYEERDGKFHLRTPEGFVNADDVEDTAGLKSALEKTRKEKREAEKKAKAATEKLGGVDVERYNKFLEEEANAEENKALEKGEFEKIRTQMVDKHQQDLDSERKVSARLRSALNEEKVEKAVVESLVKAGGNVELLKPHVISRVKLNDDDFSLVVTEPDGETPKVDGDGKPVNLEVLVAEMSEQETFKAAFKGTTQSGSGSEPGKGGEANANANGGKPIQQEGLRRGTMTNREKIDYQKEFGLDKFMDIPQ